MSDEYSGRHIINTMMPTGVTHAYAYAATLHYALRLWQADGRFHLLHQPPELRWTSLLNFFVRFIVLLRLRVPPLLSGLFSHYYD